MEESKLKPQPQVSANRKEVFPGIIGPRDLFFIRVMIGAYMGGKADAVETDTGASREAQDQTNCL